MQAAPDDAYPARLYGRSLVMSLLKDIIVHIGQSFSSAAKGLENLLGAVLEILPRACGRLQMISLPSFWGSQLF